MTTSSLVRHWLGRAVGALVLVALMGLGSLPAQAQKFYPDDPIWTEPPPLDTVDPQVVILSGILEWFTTQFTRPGERQPEEGVIPAQNVNTLDEVPDSPWFTNRHARKRMTLAELAAGPGKSLPPRDDQPWRVLAVKPYGDRTGILVADAADNIYLLRFDSEGDPELQTGASLVSSLLYYAAGWNVLENYLVYFERPQLVIGDGAEKINSYGKLRDLLPDDVDQFLDNVPRDGERGYRAVATRVPRRPLLGNWQFYGTRSDDPNDIVPHEHRRDLRGLWVMHAWVNNYAFTPANTQSVLVSDGVGQPQYIRRYLVDFFMTLGAGRRGPKEARDGNAYRFDLDEALRNIASMGVTQPWWAKGDYPNVPGVGRFGGEVFEADEWTADTHFVTWADRLPDDLYWGAKLVMSFSDEEVRTIVDQGGYSDPRTSQWIAQALIERRDKVGRAFFSQVLPLDNFRIENGKVAFDDLMETYGFTAPRQFDAVWYSFDNMQESSSFIRFDESDPFAIPAEAQAGPEGSYWAIGIEGDTPGMTVIAYLRREADGFEIVGLDRNWPEKSVVEPQPEVRADVSFSRYASLDDERKALLDGPARAYNETTGRDLTTQEWFDQLSLSERTTFDAITNALMDTELTDADGRPLGRAFDIVAGLERIAGQYSGRGGDQQFRLYVDLEPDAVDLLERSTQFFPGHENTVYHIGYPHSYRQEGEVPNMQVSVSEDGTRADIDVDYRSSKAPQALFNGHLTSSNSDVRSGDNFDKHTNRWVGLVNWWQGIFGNVDVKTASTNDLLARTVDELPTPLPPDRPISAAPVDLPDAAQEFLTDWLVRGKIDEAMTFFSRRAIACINIDEGNRDELLSLDDAIVAMRDIMTTALQEVPDRDNLTEAIDAVPPENEDQASRIEEQPFGGDFTVMALRNQVAADYTCSTRRGGEPPPMPGGPDATGTYWGVLFRFKARDNMGGVLGLLWDQLDGSWKISSYAILQQ
ncbi:MAG: hypothetical protein PVJ49_12335 [Acidobacteriota bacterium]